MKRVFGMIEAAFDTAYLAAALVIGFILTVTAAGSVARLTAGIMALILVCGDAFHLIPRIVVIITAKEEPLRKALGRGKQITSITMTGFYLILWHLGLLVFDLKNVELWSYTVYALAAVRILLCLFPQNKWLERYPPVRWGVWRNIPFFLLGAAVAGLFFVYRNAVQGFELMWLAVLLSFLFYLPVVLLANKYSKVGMLMLPKSCTYVWMLAMCLNL
jgi:hypothetical protein